MDETTRVFVTLVTAGMATATMFAARTMYHQTFDPCPCVCRCDKAAHGELWTGMGRLPHGGGCSRCPCREYVEA